MCAQHIILTVWIPTTIVAFVGMFVGMPVVLFAGYLEV